MKKTLFRVLVSIVTIFGACALIAYGIYNIENREKFYPSEAGIIFAVFLFIIAAIVLLSLLWYWILLSDEIRLDLKEKGIMENKIILEINLESDKRAIASILVANGYAVKIEGVKNGNRSKKVLVAWKD